MRKAQLTRAQLDDRQVDSYFVLLASVVNSDVMDFVNNRFPHDMYVKDIVPSKREQLPRDLSYGIWMRRVWFNVISKR